MIFYMCCYVLFSVDKLGALVIVKRISTAQARKICVGAAGVVVPCAFSDKVVTFRGRRKGNL